MPGPVSIWMDDCPKYEAKPASQLSLLPSMDDKMSTGGGYARKEMASPA